ncbi:acyl carrier protein [Putridiphycobacter roseus]|uniref:Acyl carrier protein n=1 Tax=Putridiphycobacter roseus TaxID=2219161 RepID=A0A2W1MWT1_9FLAO|nr:phosphopantetheine-binding protein [Putridiphycobacter roseus]PZE16337.1 acyl carrier protein [Putridiphycobacter roseus]
METFLIDKIEEIAFSTVNKEDSLWQEGVLDSITIVELAVEIEKEYQIKIPFDEIIESNFETVALLINYIQSKQNA